MVNILCGLKLRGSLKLHKSDWPTVQVVAVEPMDQWLSQVKGELPTSHPAPWGDLILKTPLPNGALLAVGAIRKNAQEVGSTAGSVAKPQPGVGRLAVFRIKISHRSQGLQKCETGQPSSPWIFLPEMRPWWPCWQIDWDCERLVTKFWDLSGRQQFQNQNHVNLFSERSGKKCWPHLPIPSFPMPVQFQVFLKSCIPRSLAEVHAWHVILGAKLPFCLNQGIAALQWFSPSEGSSPKSWWIWKTTRINSPSKKAAWSEKTKNKKVFLRSHAFYPQHHIKIQESLHCPGKKCNFSIHFDIQSFSNWRLLKIPPKKWNITLNHRCFPNLIQIFHLCFAHSTWVAAG